MLGKVVHARWRDARNRFIFYPYAPAPLCHVGTVVTRLKAGRGLLHFGMPSTRGVLPREPVTNEMESSPAPQHPRTLPFTAAPQLVPCSRRGAS